MPSRLGRVLGWLAAAVTQTPAGGEPPVPPRTEMGRRLPGHYPRQRPIPHHNHGHLERTADVWECGCVCVWRAHTSRWDAQPCWRHAFDREWEARLPQS